ncbi:S-layer homology domain-containing protein [Selenomonas sputigena]|uniref:S-layer homology domain-containing protein n=1 Tax=Selenomonas sputigena TaxID=69823 RepID=UPI0022346AE7|nr:S-layer homology domain-containing protein [Selenomonas sputigena]UZE44918.1 S-layer homology domain-containing protein [Selenomonas sputigena]
MKKTLTAALTTALVVGAASTTFAAANPFSDVPADHWAYDAVAQLADDGVIEGYGDGTYRGQNEITRYEMAQMVAKAMAKEDQVNAQQKAMIDRLAAEFSEELNNLGVRVSNLESRIDNVKWEGKLQYEYTRTKKDGQDATTDHDLKFRLEPTATVNDHWKVKARLDAHWNPNSDQGKEDDNGNNPDNSVKLTRAYVAGHYGITDINAGLIPYYSEQGVVFDGEFSGASVTVGKDQTLAGTLLAGRAREIREDAAGAPSNVQGLNVMWKPSEEFSGAAEYYRASLGNDYNNIWGIGATYNFAKTASLNGGYWKNTTADNSVTDRAWNAQLSYKGAEQENMHSFGLFVAYRRLGTDVAFNPTFDAIKKGEKGWEVGGDYTFAKNVVGTLKYFNGKQLSDDKKLNRFYGSLEYFF